MEEPAPAEANTTEKKFPTKKLLFLAGAVLVVAIIGVLVWLYLDSKSQLSAKDETIAALEAAAADTTPPAVTTDPASPAPAACAGGADYSADVGNFRVQLDSPRRIVRALDGNFEGGPITQLELGRCVSDATGVVDTYPTNAVNILAHPSSTAAELRTAYESQTGTALTPDGSVTIAGVTAQRYSADGLFATKLIYFDHTGIGYQIEITDTNTSSTATLTDATADWTFTP
jgi:hypothetical protein